MNLLKIKKYRARVILFCLVFIVLFGIFAKRLRQPIGTLFSPSDDSLSSGVVTSVYDGDTIGVRFKNSTLKKVRLIGVDSPEISDASEEVQFWAFMAKRFCFYHLYRKEVRLTYDWQREDSYGRLLAYIWKDDVLFNDFIIRQGFASALLRFPFRKDYHEKFKDSEDTARREGRGLWSKGSFPRTQVRDVRRYLGELVSVEYTCSSIQKKRGFVFLQSNKKEFSALIPQARLTLFPSPEKYLERDLVVSGFLEEFKGQPQVLIYLPRQLEIME